MFNSRTFSAASSAVKPKFVHIYRRKLIYSLQTTFTTTSNSRKMETKFTKEELKKRLTAEQYNVTQNASTDPPFSNEYYLNKEAGQYLCVVCHQKLFTSNTKYDSGSGWPAFYDCETGSCSSNTDKTHGMTRTEVTCSKCKAHLGHVFDDGPQNKTGKRYCINSSSLTFTKSEWLDEKSKL